MANFPAEVVAMARRKAAELETFGTATESLIGPVSLMARKNLLASVKLEDNVANIKDQASPVHNTDDTKMTDIDVLSSSTSSTVPPKSNLDPQVLAFLEVCSYLWCRDYCCLSISFPRTLSLVLTIIDHPRTPSLDL